MLVDIVVEHGTDSVVRRGDSMEITRKVEVDFLHRQHLSITTTSRTTLNTETRTKGRLTQSHHGFLAKFLES